MGLSRLPAERHLPSSRAGYEQSKAGLLRIRRQRLEFGEAGVYGADDQSVGSMQRKSSINPHRGLLSLWLKTKLYLHRMRSHKTSKEQLPGKLQPLRNLKVE